jgi:hypothetical protein
MVNSLAVSRRHSDVLGQDRCGYLDVGLAKGTRLHDP